MSNFVKVFRDGKLRKNFGLPTGITAMDIAMNGSQRGTSIGVAAAPKVGKTTLVDYCFVLSPYLYALENGLEDKVNWLYLSYEVSRIQKEFKFASFFMFYDYGIASFTYKGITYPMNPQYLQGKQKHNNGDDTTEIIIVSDEHDKLLKEIYYKRIIPLFGEYDENGVKLREGKIEVIETPDNPTGVYKYIRARARKHGNFNHQAYTVMNEKGEEEVRSREVSYTANDPEEYYFIVCDHIRKFRREQKFLMKENIDKWLEYTTELRNQLNYIFINISHSNRTISNIERLKFSGEWIFPTSDDVKDSGNLAEESTYMFTMFDPTDEKYNLKTHMGIDLTNKQNDNYRSIHLTDSRETDCPVHIQVNMYGGINTFQPLIY